MICKAKKAFSLVELSIVLVIIGLVTGGVLAGRDLIHASELNSIVTEHDKFLTAVAAFQGKYLALPGDMPNATDFWGANDTSYTSCDFSIVDSGNGAIPSSPVGVNNGTKTCNGNGDKSVDYAATYNVSDPGSGKDLPSEISLNMEAAVFWPELGNAGLISGTYNGSYGQIENKVDPNFPMSGPTDGSAASPSGKIAQSNWGAKGNSLYYTKSAQFNDFDLLTGADVLNIDRKTDDGAPNTGKVRPAADPSITPPCITGTGTSASYNATSTVKNCGIEFSNQF
jgi:prepilin-type N-terminal cleavage/methylation domain-containing protein